MSLAKPFTAMIQAITFGGFDSYDHRLKRGLAFKGFHVKLLWGGCVDEKLTSSSAQIPEKDWLEGSELKFCASVYVWKDLQKMA